MHSLKSARSLKSTKLELFVIIQTNKVDFGINDVKEIPHLPRSKCRQSRFSHDPKPAAPASSTRNYGPARNCEQNEVHRCSAALLNVYLPFDSMTLMLLWHIMTRKNPADAAAAAGLVVADFGEI